MGLALEILKKKHHAMLENHTCVVSDGDYSRLLQEDWLLESISEFENRTFTLYDLNSKCYHKKSNKFKLLLEYRSLDTPEKGDMARFHELVHPNDLPFVLETDMMTLEFMQSLPMNEKYNHKLVYDFRIRNPQGVYRRFVNQLRVHKADQFGNVWIIFIVSDLLSDNAHNYLPQRFMIHIQTKKFLLFDQDKHFNTYQLLTPREKEILSLVSQGWESEKIADHLSISVCTVHNHRQHIILKTQCENLTQATLYARILGII